MADLDLLNILSPEERFIVASRSGRVLQVSAALTALIGDGMTGRNLNDYLEDSLVFDLIRKADDTEVYLFDCTLGGYAFSCGSRLSADGQRLIIVCSPGQPVRNTAGGLDLLRYMSREINSNVESMNLALYGLSQSNEELRTQSMGLLGKSLMNLARISRNAAAKADFEEGQLFLSKHPGDLLLDVVSVCHRAAALAGDHADIRIESDAPSGQSLYDSTAVQRTVLNLIAYALGHSPLSCPRLRIRVEQKEQEVCMTLHSAGSRLSEVPEPLLPGGEIPYGRELELDIAGILIRAMSGHLISSAGKDDAWTCRVSFPLDHSENAPLATTVIDWYGGADIVAAELSGVLPPSVYYNGPKA